MAQEVILMADVPGLGAEGEVVKVADGYARNYLLPQKLAASVTEATRRRLEAKRKERGKQLTADKEAALALAKTIEQCSCTITVKAGVEGKMFGSVTAADIVASLKTQGIEVDKHKIDLQEPIRELGVFHVPVKVHQEVQTALKVWVVEE
jgi:large subunit ribosomal protein L9